MDGWITQKENKAGKMKDYLKEHKFKNLFPHNPTQTIDLRFLRTPESKITTAFSKSAEKMQKAKDGLKTYYTDFLDDVRDILKGAKNAI